MNFQDFKYLALILWITILAGCFTTRTPEPPLQSVASSQWLAPTDYNILILNFKNSVQQLNTQNYLRCIADTFEFIPTQVRDNSASLIFQKWTKNDEKTYFDNLNAKSLPLSPHSLQFKNAEHQFVGSDTVKYNADYHLDIQHSDSTFIRSFKGQIHLTLHRNREGLWRIVRWQDVEKAKDSSWTLLKIRYIQ